MEAAPTAPPSTHPSMMWDAAPASGEDVQACTPHVTTTPGTLLSSRLRDLTRSCRGNLGRIPNLTCGWRGEV